MSFRTNLQYLRAQRNMTQERLAMLARRLAAGHFEMGIREGLPRNGQAAHDLRSVRLHA